MDCQECTDMGIKPARMDAEDVPVCGCGRPARLPSGACSSRCKSYCQCEHGAEAWREDFEAVMQRLDELTE